MISSSEGCRIMSGGKKGGVQGREAWGPPGRPTASASIHPKVQCSKDHPREGQRCTSKAWPPTFVLLGTGDAGELGVQLVLLGDLQNTGSVVHHHGEQVRAARDLEDVLDVGQVV